MKIRSLITTYAAIGGALLLASQVSSEPSTERNDPPSPQSAAAQSVPSALERNGDVLSVDPGRVSFEFSPTGRWYRFGPKEGRALIGGGGFLVLVRGADNKVVSVVDTRAGGLHVLPGVRGLGKVHEGIENGRRYPSSRPNDDGDGAVDEDRLDGKDNDSDGRIDEDFAAIGDEMVVTAYRPLPDVSSALPVIEVHQETYGWSLRHIDGMVVTRLSVRNTGRAPAHDVRVGAAFPKRREFSVESQAFGAIEEAAGFFGKSLDARGLLLQARDEVVAAIFFSPQSDDDEAGSWLTGVTRKSGTIAALVQASLSEIPFTPSTPEDESADAEESSAGDSDRRYVAYGVSPSLGTLEPGEETFVYVVLVAPPSVDAARRSIDFAFRTVVGDGVSRMIPPPVSLKRHTIWGMYEVDYTGGLTITLHDARGQGINPMEIAYLRGFDVGSSVRSTLPDGTARIEFAHKAPATLEENERVIMQGRMENGEWFDAVLEPSIGPDAGQRISAERYFGRSGKLDEALITGSPNPFRDVTTIAYEVPSQLHDEFGNTVELSGSIDASVKVYGVTGRLVTTLVDDLHSPGRYQLQWNAHNETGATVASGVYYIKLQIGKRHVTKRLIQLK